jgi:hypothetical protein
VILTHCRLIGGAGPRLCGHRLAFGVGGEAGVRVGPGLAVFFTALRVDGVRAA